ncbi:MAG: PAS domain S-box protein [Anaerolineae bacterium]
MADVQQLSSLTPADKQAAFDRLLQGVAEVAGGNFDYRLDLGTDAEWERTIGDQFEHMLTRFRQEVAAQTTRLEAEIAERERAEAEIEQNYSSQQVLNALLQISLQEISLAEQLEQALEVILSTPWLPMLPKGGIFLVEDTPDALVLKAQRGLASPLLNMCSLVPFGHCLCGRAALSRQIEHADCVDHRHDNMYDGITPHGHYNIPVMVDGEVGGVIVLYLNDGHPYNEREATFLEAVANTLAGLIKRKRAQRALKRVRDELELRVQERTAELSETNRTLSAEIAERKRVEEELIKFKVAIEHSADAIFITEVDGTIVYANPAFQKIYGFSRQETLGQTPRILKSGLTPPEEYKKLWGTLLAKKNVSGEIINKTKDGRLIHIDRSNNPILDEAGNLIGFLAINRDITRRKQAQEDTQRRAHREQTIRQITEKLQAAGTLESLVKTAAEELGERLSAGHVVLNLGIETNQPQPAIEREATNGNRL